MSQIEVMACRTCGRVVVAVDELLVTEHRCTPGDRE